MWQNLQRSAGFALMYESITLDIEANIAVLTLNRLAVMNAMSAQMRAEIV